jgi:phosphoglycolate phosphatase
LKAIVFDFDGVILESMNIKTQAFRDLFSDYPEHQEAIVKLHLDNGGMSRFEKFRIIYREFLGKHLTDADTDEMGQRFSRLVFDSVLKCPYVTGAHEFLEKVHKTYELYVASGTPQDELREIVRLRGLDHFFRNVYGSPDSKVTILARIMLEQSLKPEEVVFVGDAMGDYRSAKETSVHFIGRVPRNCPNPFPQHNVLTIVEDLEKLMCCWNDLPLVF